MSRISRGGGLSFELIFKYGVGGRGMYKFEDFEPIEYRFDHINDMINKLNNSCPHTYAAIKFYLWERGYVKLVSPFPQTAYFFGDGERYRAQHRHNPRDPLCGIIDPSRVRDTEPFFDYSGVLIDLRYVKVLPTEKLLRVEKQRSRERPRGAAQYFYFSVSIFLILIITILNTL
jgi:hypothetical protein